MRRHPIAGAITAAIVLVASILLVLFFFWDQQAFLQWKQDAGPIPFFLALATLPALGIPTTPFFLLAGAAFGLSSALLGSAIAIAVNLCLCYLLSQTLLRRWLLRVLNYFDYSIPSLPPGKAITFILAIKLTPGPPTFLKNYITALTGAPFRYYLLIGWSITFAYAASFIVLGESFLDRDWSQAVWALLLLGSTLLILWLLRKRFSRH